MLSILIAECQTISNGDGPNRNNDTLADCTNIVQSLGWKKVFALREASETASTILTPNTASLKVRLEDCKTLSR